MANLDFDIDDLKKSWQEQTVTEVYGTSEIEAMLNKKSRNYVKYIFGLAWLSFYFLQQLVSIPYLRQIIMRVF